MAQSNVVRTNRDAQVIVLDSGGVNRLTLDMEPGDFNFAVPEVEVTNNLDRGEIGSTPSLRKGDEQPVTGGFSAWFRDPGDTAGTKTYTTLMDALVRWTSGYADATWVSTLGSASDVDTWTIQYTINGSAFGESDKTISFPFSVLRLSSFQEGKTSTVSASFTSYCQYGKPVLT
jgi:hypothetical protein